MAINQNNAIEVTKSLTSNKKLVNQLTGSSFIVHDFVLDQDINIDLRHPDFENKPEIKQWVNETFVALCNGWANTELQTLSGRTNTLKGYRISILRIAVWASNNQPNLPISQWKEIHVTTLLSDLLNDNVNLKTGDTPKKIETNDRSPLNRNTLENVFFILKKSNLFRFSGLTSDGLSIIFSKRYFKDTLSDLLKPYGLNYEEWYRTEGWKAIPLPIAMLMLHQSIELIRDNKTIFLREYFIYQRSKMYYPVSSIFGSPYENFCLGKFRKNGSPNIEKAKGLKELTKKYFVQDQKKFPMTSSEITSHCHDVYEACLVIFLCMTGARISEIASINADDYKIESDGIWTFKSDLIKTNMGLPEVREMHGLVAEAAQTLVDLSYIDKRNREDEARVPLFGKYFSKSFASNTLVKVNEHRTSSTKSSLAYCLKRYFSKFLERHPEFEKECDNIFPHRFRHTWAEFALRRFEGNVFEAIRRHFRHSFGSYFTTHYVFGKLSDEVKSQIEEEFLREVITKAVTENVEALKDESFKRDLYGKAVKSISESMGNQILTTEQIPRFVEDIIDDFDSIVTHEYGYCMVRTSTQHLSQCLDKKTQIPDLKKGSFNTCKGCINFVRSESSHKATITQIAATHSQMINSFTEMFGKNVQSPVVKASREAVRQAEIFLKEMGDDTFLEGENGS